MEFNWLDHLRVYMYFAFSSIPYKNISNSFCDMILFLLFSQSLMLPNIQYTEFISGIFLC